MARVVASARWIASDFFAARFDGSYPQMVSAQGFSAPWLDPAADAYFKNVIIPTCAAAGDLGADNPGLFGISFDLEIYGGPLLHVDGFSFSDAAATVLPELAAVPAGERLAYLEDHGALKAYFAALEERAWKWGKSCREAVRAKAPNLELLLYAPAFPDSWFYRGFMRGLGTAEHPLVLLTYEAWADEPRRVLNGEGVSMVHLGGVINHHWTPDSYDDALVAAGKNNDGYWYLSFNDFSAINPHPPTLHGAGSAYFTALDGANAALDDAK